MDTFIFILMVLLLIVVLERTNRRQSSSRPPSLNGPQDPDDRDWARIKHDLLAAGDHSVTNNRHRPRAA